MNYMSGVKTIKHRTENIMENTNIISACGYTSDGCCGNCQACLSAEVCPVFNDTGTAEAQVEVNPDGIFVRLG